MGGKDSRNIIYPVLEHAILLPLDISKPRKGYKYNYLWRWKQRIDGQLVIEHAGNGEAKESVQS